MSVNYSVPVLASRLQQVVNAIDAGAGNGIMRLLNSGGSPLSSFQLAKPMGTIVANVLTFSGLPLIDPAAGASGAASGARVEDSNGNVVISGLVVGGATPDIILTPTNVIVAGQSVGITAATITGN